MPTLTHVSTNEVQQFLEQTKLELSDVDTELEKTASEVVLAALSRVYDTSTWVDTTTTPNLVRKVIGMFVAAWVYARQYSEDISEDNNYATRLEARAQILVDGIVSGVIDLLDVVGTVGSTSGPVFYPTDLTGSEQIYDGLGNTVGLPGSEDIAFRMGTSF